MMPDETERFVDKVCIFLKQAGKRCTPLRQNILRVLFECQSVSVRELKALLDERHGCAASALAIYKNLELFGALHLAVKSFDDNAVHFTLGFKRNRVCLVCIRCGKSVELHERDMAEAIRRKCGEYRFELTDMEVTLLGICQGCRNDND